MADSPQSYTRSLWVGLGGFILAGIIANLATWMLFASGLLGLVLGLVPQGQALVRLWLGIVLVFVGLGLGGAAGGLARGYTLSQIDRLGSRKRYLLGGAFSSGISHGILVIPALLFISLVSIYNVGSRKDPASFVYLFALIGGVFGFLNGALLSLITVRLRYAWLPWLGSVLGSLVGGALFGLLMWRPDLMAGSLPEWGAMVGFLVLAGVAINAATGGVLGVIFARLSRKNAAAGGGALAPRRWQDVTIVLLGSLVFITVASSINQIAEFVTIHPGSHSTSLSSQTQGVHFEENLVISTDLLAQDEPAFGLSAGPQELVTAWSSAAGEIMLASQRLGTEAPSLWSTPLNVSQSPQAASLHPQVAAGSDGAVHVVWSENGQIWYNRCLGGACQAPASLSAGVQACKPDAAVAQEDWPAIALAPDGILMAAWQAGEGAVAYVVWGAGSQVEDGGAGCLESGLPAVRPRLAAGKPGEFWLALSGEARAPGAVSLVGFRQAGWGVPLAIGQGGGAEVYTDHSGILHAAWCGADGMLNYLSAGGSVEVLNTSPCLNRPSIFEDADDRLHLVYVTDQWQDNFGAVRYGNALVETIRLAEEWSEAALVADTSQAIQQAAVGRPGGDSHLTWVGASDENLALWHTHQLKYECDPASVSDPLQAILDVVQSGEFHPADYQSPFCGNRFEGLVYMPRPSPEFTILPAGMGNGFIQVSELIKKGRYEVLISNMQWDADQDNLSPGSRLAQAIAELYQKVKANPEAYPRGLTVRILLGNYPNLSTFEYGDQIWNVVQDLVDAGVETMEDPAIGWKVEVANYRGSFPHSHTKFLVVDGKTLLSAGFNVSWYHLPKDDPSGKGDDLTDLGMVLTGPVAQTGIAVFDDLWQGANQLICEDPIPADLKRLKRACTWKQASAAHIPETMKYFLPGSTDTAIAMYRTADYKEADRAYSAALASAKTSIDAMHVNFSADMICLVNLISPGVCTYANTLPYMEALVTAIEQNGVHVRVIVENANLNGLENRVGIQILQDELSRRGLEDHLEVRFFDGRLHAKSAIIDGQVVIIGSQNFHYSSFSKGGLLEFGAATQAPLAVDIYQTLFDYYWQHAIPEEESEWGSAP